MMTRRELLALLPFLALSLGARRVTVHPTPRAGITAARVLRSDQLKVSADVLQIFENVRTIPHIVDGIYCYCGCAELPDHYSLLSCYEQDGMAQSCLICQGEAQLTFELHQQGKSLDQIRAAIDRNFA